MANREALLTLLHRETEAVAAVLAALEAENAALLERDAEALRAAAAGKADAVDRAGRLEQERREMMALNGFLGGGADLRIEEQLAGLKDLARRCRELNERNGALIRGQRRRVEGALHSLRGEPATATYGPDGSTLGPRARGRLASW